MEETLLLEKRTKNRAPSLCIGGGIRTHTVTLASDFESGAFNAVSYTHLTLPTIA